MFTPYYGELLTSPTPVEISGNFCTNHCSYCFANLNKPDRRIDISQAFRFVDDLENRTTWTAELVRMGYPVLISNKSDPFSESNSRLFVPLIRLMIDRGIPLSIQTKGGTAAFAALPFMPRSHWYLSIAYSNDAVRKRIEPGAPSIESRIELVKELLRAGHKVSVAVNPLVEEWESCPERLIDSVASLGVKNFWIETLHLNNNQTRNMPQRDKDAIGENIIKRVFKKSDAGIYAFFKRCINHVRQSGLNAYCVNYPYATDYFTEFEQLYKKTFPTMQGFLNHLVKHNGTAAITFDDYCNYFIPRLPQTNRNLMDYIGASNPLAKRHIKQNRLHGWKPLLAAFWKIDKLSLHPYQNRAFDYVVDSNGEPITEKGMPVFALSNAGL